MSIVLHYIPLTLIKQLAILLACNSLYTILMAQTCQRCERGPMSANSRSHSKVATKRLQKLNLQKFKIDGQKLLICTNCIKTLNKTAA